MQIVMISLLVEDVKNEYLLAPVESHLQENEGWGTRPRFRLWLSLRICSPQCIHAVAVIGAKTNGRRDICEIAAIAAT